MLCNKNDQVDCMNEYQASEAMALKQINDRLVAVYCVSAKNQQNLNLVIDWLSKLEKK